MSDAGTLLLVLILLYLSDCLVLVNRHAVMVRAHFRRFRIRVSNGALGNARGALMWLNPLPPFGTLFLARPWPVTISPDAVAAYSSQTLSPLGRPPQTCESIRFADIRETTTNGRDLIINGTVFAHCDSEALATRLAELIRTLQALPPESRETTLQQAWLATLDIDELAGRIAHFRQSVRVIRPLCILLWTILFVIGPALITSLGSLMPLLPLIGVALLVHIPIVILYRRAHRNLLPHHRADRFEHTLKMAPCPPMSIRAIDALSRHVTEAAHPLALSALLAARDDFQSFATALVRDLAHPIAPLPEAPLTMETDHWFRTHQLQWMVPFLARHGSTVEQALAAPPATPDALTYCPRCTSVLTLASGNCPDCSGVPLVSFTPSQGKPPA
jgi:hypothetical protein